MAESFGARLRGRREELGIDLIAIASQTKIKTSLLEGLERGDVSHWPAGIFRRAYVRAYAQAIGLDPDVVLREFLDAHPEPDEIVTTEAIAAAVDGGRSSGGPPTRLRYIMGSALGSFVRFRRNGNGSAAEPHAAPEPAAVPSLGSADVAGDDIDLERVHDPVHLQEAEDRVDTLRLTADDPHTETALDELDLPERSQADADFTESLLADDLPPAEVVEAAPSPEASSEPFMEDERWTPEDNDPVVHSSDAVEPAPVQASAMAFEEPAVPERPAGSDLDLLAFAQLCMGFSRVEDTTHVQHLLSEAARLLDAPGLVLWAWDPAAEELVPALAHGYSDRVLAQLPALKPHADNATAAAFRTGETRVIDGSGRVSGGIVVPLPAPRGCTGVLAIELQPGQEHRGPVRAAATILGALLAQLLWASAPQNATAELDGSDVAGLAHAARG